MLNPKPIGKFYLNVDCCCFCLSEDLTFSTCLDFLSQPTQIKACCLANRIKGKTFTATCLPCYGFVIISMGKHTLPGNEQNSPKSLNSSRNTCESKI